MPHLASNSTATASGAVTGTALIELVHVEYGYIA